MRQVGISNNTTTSHYDPCYAVQNAKHLNQGMVGGLLLMHMVGEGCTFYLRIQQWIVIYKYHRGLEDYLLLFYGLHWSEHLIHDANATLSKMGKASLPGT